ncbi:SixA phosphatase family protein [Roseiconus nitratireducens]|nr:histidine phosphatase family protein [Roseiconus nitratireducens]
MANQLILMRHAKSSHDDAALSDHDRPLSPRGRHDAPRMADWLDQQDAVPHLILCSTATRTRQTAELMLTRWGKTPIVSFCKSLYLASPEAMLATVRSDHCDQGSIMILAHNPGISELASILAGQSLPMPTAAVAIFDLPATQADKPGRESRSALDRLSVDSRLPLVAFTRPKALDP